MKINIRHSILILLLLISAAAVSAQDSLHFSLQEAKDYALKNSWAIRNSSVDVLAAKKKVWETIASGLPQVSATGNYTKNLKLAVTPLPAEIFGGPAGEYIEVSFGQKYNSDFGLRVDQQIFDGSYIVGVGSAQLYLEISNQAKAKTEIEILHTVEQAYYGALIARQNLDVMKDNLANNQKLESDTKALYENGFVEEQDVDQLKLQVQRSENEILKAEREIRVAEMVLKYTIGVEMNSPIGLTDELDSFLNPLLVEEEPTTESAFDYNQHIDYRIADLQRQANFKLLRLEQSAALPRVSAFYTYSKNAFGNNANLFGSGSQWFPSSLVGLSVSVPIFSSGMRMAKVSQARFELEKSENDLQLAQQTLQKDYLTAIADLESAVDQLKNDVDNKQLAKRIYDRTLIKYNNGLVSSTELAQTESQFIQAQGSWVASVMQLFNSKINLDKAIGK